MAMKNEIEIEVDRLMANASIFRRDVATGIEHLNSVKTLMDTALKNIDGVAKILLIIKEQMAVDKIATDVLTDKLNIATDKLDRTRGETI
jgi:hypothetical protein